MPSKVTEQLVGDNNWINEWDPYLPDVVDWHEAIDYHNLAFLDGRVEFLEIVKGEYLNGNYRIMPFAELNGMARNVVLP